MELPFIIVIVIAIIVIISFVAIIVRFIVTFIPDDIGNIVAKLEQEIINIIS